LLVLFGTRDAGAAYHFIHDLAARLSDRVQLTTDEHKAYLSAIEDAFGSQIDYAIAREDLRQRGNSTEVRYSPDQCMGARKAVINGQPNTITFPRASQSARTFQCGMECTDLPASRMDQQEARESRTRAGIVLHALQLLQDSPNLTRDSGDGAGSLTTCGR